MSNFFIASGYPDSAINAGSAPNTPNEARYPFSENLRISRFAHVSKVSSEEAENLSPGDLVLLQDERGAFLQFNGEKILYLIGSDTAVDGSVQLKVLPYQEFATFSKPLVPPYLQVAVDKEKLQTVFIELQDVQINNQTLKRVVSVTPGCLDSNQLKPTGAQFSFMSDETTLVAPYPVLSLNESLPADGNHYKTTLMISNQDLWTLVANAQSGFLFFQFPV